MNNELIHAKLKENNPFISSASPLPFDNKNPDLQQLNRHATQEIEQLVLYKRRQPSLPLAGLILGEAGSGKTHMQSRILRNLRSKEQQTIFVTVKTFRDPERITQHLLSEVFISLRQTHSQGRNQFDMLMDELMKVYNERRESEGWNDIKRLELKKFLARDIIGLDRNFLKCLIIYLSGDEETRFDVLEWLSNGLAEEDSNRLDLPLRDLDAMSDAQREEEAEKILKSLGLVLAYAKVLMVICFDELDILKTLDKEATLAWGNIIAMLMNNLSGVLPLCFVHLDTWEEVIKPALSAAIEQRLVNNLMALETCSIQQAEALIHDRVIAAFPDPKDNAEEIFSWLRNQIGNSLKRGLSPRQVIDLANRAINKPIKDKENISLKEKDSPAIESSQEIFEAVKAAYDEEYKNVQARQLIAWPPNSENLTLALEAWLRSKEEFKVAKVYGKYIRLNAQYKGVQYAFVIVVPQVASTATAAITHGINFLQRSNGGCFYLLETRSYRSTWKLFDKLKDDFINMGGAVVELNKETRVQWYALVSLLNRIENGNVNLFVGENNRPATRDDAKSFIKTLNLIDLSNFSRPEVKTPPAPDILPVQIEKNGGDILFDSLREMFTGTSIKLVSIEKVIENLAAMTQIKISKPELTSYLKSKKIFNVIECSDDVLVSLASRA